MFVQKNSEGDGIYFDITIKGIDSRVFNFKASDKIESLTWYNEIKRHIENSDGHKE